jgi:hypothetical protein
MIENPRSDVGDPISRSTRGDRALRTLKFGLFLVLVATGCTSTSRLTPVAYPDPSQPCPAGRSGWRIEVMDRRADRAGSEGVVSLLAESIRKSFPGCQWDAEAGEGAGLISIEVHRFAARPEGNAWDAAASWTVLATESGGRTLTEFETDEEVSRPNYRGSNNALEALREAFDRAIRRTIAGLRVVSSAAMDCPSGRTPPESAGSAGHSRPKGTPYVPMSCDQGGRVDGNALLERFSHRSGAEAL